MAEFLVSTTESVAEPLSSIQNTIISETGKEAARSSPSNLKESAYHWLSVMQESAKLRKLLIQCATEFLGMFIFLFLALGGVQSALRTNSVSEMALNPTLAFIEISICFGFGLSAAVFFAYRISGGALNPAVNFGLFVAGVMNPITLVSYTISQVIGATAACGVVDAVFPGDFKGANQVFDGTTTAQAFFLELILTMGLVLIVLFLAVEKSKITFWAPMMIGIYVFVAHLLAIPYTNTSINPARSFGASVAAGQWSDHWLFWVAPLCGGALAGVIYRGYKIAEYHTLNPGQDAEHKA